MFNFDIFVGAQEFIPSITYIVGKKGISLKGTISKKNKMSVAQLKLYCSEYNVVCLCALCNGTS